uniref:Uncharacterized protein n=1 Tax=Nelumbo nucifera TaxID=4432 RepID=A0A822YEG4_NELNU|nr:TPA_asm: hypothetical protein HUJ06_030823 [Nelumbo nucifera]
MLDQLNLYWSNIKCPSNDGRFLWKSAWKTYGVCSGLSEHDYFERALKLRSDADMLSILGENGIIPTYYVDYSLFEVEEAINNEFEDAAAIRCSVDYKNGKSQLYEIYVCVDKDANKIIPLVEEVNELKYQMPYEALQQMAGFRAGYIFL